MIVVHVVKVTGIAGAERHLLTLLSGLSARDLDVRIILLVEPDNPVDEYAELLEGQGIPVQRLVIHNDLDVTLYWRLWRTFRQIKPDIVHTHLWHADLFGIPAARLAWVKHVVTSRHNDDAFRYKFAIRLVNRFLWWMSSAGIAISEAIRRFSIAVEKVRPRKIHTVRYGIEHDPDAVDRPAVYKAIRDELGLDDDSLLVGMVCRLTEQKGVIYGIRAFAGIADDFPDAHLLIAGDGPLREEFEAEVETLNLVERVHFLGWREDVPALMAALDIFLMPSLWEGFGMVLLEAMAQQIPVVASAVSAIPEVVADGESGLLVPPRDEPMTRYALRVLLMDRPLRRYMGLLGEDRLETDFNAARMVEETLVIYRDLAHNPVDG